MKRVCFVIAVILCIATVWAGSTAEDWESYGYAPAYAICMKDDYVNIRPFPNTKRERSGWLEPGDPVWLDGKKKGDYVHVVGLSTEDGEGWVHAGYLVDDVPEFVDADAVIVSRGRLAARKFVNGKRTRWLKPGGIVHVYFLSEEWCATNCGYIRTKYLELIGDNEE